jgi:uncharacterized protein with ParB-like and HNH nuclease domain
MHATGPQMTNGKLENIHTLLRGIENGEIRVPVFQRGFIWSKPQIIKLLWTIYNGWPIGSIVLWNTSNKSIATKSGDSIPFPSSHPQYPITFIIDGLQRLSALYGAFGYRTNREHDPRFSIGFDLREGAFRSISKKDPLKSHEIFTRYQIHVATIIGDWELSEVFEIFKRLNTEGTRLRPSQLDKEYRW